MCEHCLDLGVNIDAMPHDWALKQPQPKLADAVRLFGKCPYCCDADAAAPVVKANPLIAAPPTKQLVLFP